MAGHDDRRGVEVHGALARALHPSTFRLKVSTVGCLGGVRGYFGATWGGVYGELWEYCVGSRGLSRVCIGFMLSYRNGSG